MNDVVRMMEASGEFEVLAPVPLNVICFRYKPGGLEDPDRLNALNAALLEALNGTGKAYFTHTKLAGRYSLRFVIGQTEVEERHVKAAWELIRKTAREIGDRMR